MSSSYGIISLSSYSSDLIFISLIIDLVLPISKFTSIVKNLSLKSYGISTPLISSDEPKYPLSDFSNTLEYKIFSVSNSGILLISKLLE